MKLKLKIAQITNKAEAHAKQLATANWMRLCESLGGTLGTGKTWNIPKSLLDTMKTKSENNKIMERLIHYYPGTELKLIKEVEYKCFGDIYPNPYAGNYHGEHNPDLDQPITKEEIRAALAS